MNCLKKFFAAILVFGCFSLGASVVYPQSDSARKAMIERQEQMVKMHQKMVKCLKSKKSIDECRAQMKENCPMMQGGSCPMMGDGAPGMKDGAGCGQGSGPHGPGMGMGRSN